MSTTYTDLTKTLFYIGQARTDAAGVDVDDASGEDLRAVLDVFSEGVVSGLEVTERAAGANMSVDVAVGSAVIEGQAHPDQGKYLAKIAGASATNVVIGAADLSNPRIDEIYLPILDDGYDSSGFVLPRIAYRDGTPASSPSAPGPDGAWDAYLLLATIAVAANETAIETEHITDERDFAELALASSGGTPTGALLPFAGAAAPDGYLLCNGAAVSRASFAALFDVIGTTWGVGDGSTTFNIPDMRGRYPRGVAASGTGDELAESFGADTLPNHVHQVDPPSTASAIESQASHVFDDPGDSPSNPINLDVATADHTHATNIAPFNSGNPTTSPSILPASRAVNYIIKT